MREYFEWRNASVEGKPHIEAIFFTPHSRPPSLVIKTGNFADADELQPFIARLDPKFDRDHKVYILSKLVTPEKLASFLWEESLIGKACHDELTREMKEFRAGYRGR